LAEELTRLVHGDDGLTTAQRATEIFFGAEISDLTDAQLVEIFSDVPSKSFPRQQLTDGGGLAIVDALAGAGLAKSKGEARRAVEQGGAYVNNRRVASVDARLTTADLVSETVLVLRSGKKNYALLRFE
jgi:tyrosyl-tRNA synthetase